MILRLSLFYLTILSVLLSRSQLFAAPTPARIDQDLRPRLSPNASVVHYSSAAPRWSSYHAPQPGTIVNVANENDVIETVKYCISNNLDFLVQSGGHGYATTFDIENKDLIINMRGLNQIQVSDAKDQITFGGGAISSELSNATIQNQVETTLPTCSCVGMGAILGGGINHLLGHYGLMIDNLLSVNLVTADTKLITVTPTSSPDLWWALRGAGANFGVVTSVTMKTYPPLNNGTGWIGHLEFSPDRLEDLVQVLSDFEYTKEMSMYLTFRQSAPDFTPTISLMFFYFGSDAEARTALKTFYDLGPVNDTSKEGPSRQFYTELDSSCEKGLRRPTYSAFMKKLDPVIFREIWNEYVSLVSENPSFNKTALKIESYSTETLRKISDSGSAFPYRSSFDFLANVYLTYEDPKLDSVAERFGKRFRELWVESSEFNELRTYINYGHGDEDPKAIYGENLPRLKEIKKRWDRHGRFSHFFGIHRGKSTTLACKRLSKVKKNKNF